MLVLATVILLGQATVGERGLLRSFQARRDHASAVADLARLRQENARLRDEVGRLRSDPATIESVARRELAFVRPGEIVVTVSEPRP